MCCMNILNPEMREEVETMKYELRSMKYWEIPINKDHLNWRILAGGMTGIRT
jgi:hypothetical protein